MRVVFLLLLIPAAVSASTLDDYYLSRFGETGRAARALGAIVPGEVVQAERCLTPLYRSLKRDWKQLEPATQKVLAKHLARPVFTGAAATPFPSPGGHFSIHYALSGSDAPDPADVDPQNGVPDYVDKVAAVFDHVYSVEVNVMGYKAPPVGRYDVYLRDLVPERAYGFTSDDGFPSYPVTSVASYIEIDRAFTDHLFTASGYTPEQSLQITAAHEFHHAIQYGYNYYFDIWYAEVTSTWMEDEVYDSVNQLYDYLPKYLPLASTLSLNAPLGGNSEYGRWIFNRHLAERHSPDMVRKIWEKLGATAAPQDGNDIPMLPVVNVALAGDGSTLSADFLGFARKLYLQDWGSHSSDIGLIPSVAPQATYLLYPIDMTGINALIATLPRYAFAYYKFLPTPSAPNDLTLAFANVPAGVDIIAIKKRTNGSIDEYSLDRATGTITVPSFSTADSSGVQLIICNGASDPAPPAAITTPASSGKSGGCFIATAAYGSYLHPKVAELRAFRDRYLLTNAPGRLFVSLYYRLSPPVAHVIGEHGWMRGGVRVLLTPVVLAVEHPMGALVVFLLSGGGVVWRLARRRRSIRVAEDTSLA